MFQNLFIADKGTNKAGVKNQMKIYYSLIFLLLIPILNPDVSAAEIRGKVVDAKTCEPLAGAYITVSSARLSTGSDKEGLYIIKDLSPGTYIIKTSFIAYYPQTDTIEIKDTSEIVELNISLRSMTVELNEVSTPGLEAYHKMILESNKSSSSFVCSYRQSHIHKFRIICIFVYDQQC